MKKMQQLSGTDAAFLYMDTPDTPMQFGGLYIIAPREDGQVFDFETFKKFISERLEIVPIFRKKLAKPTLGLAHPFWIEDRDFNIDNHLMRVAAPSPGGMNEVMTLAQKLYSKPLDISQPLWETVVIEGVKLEGYPENSFVLLTKVHHAAIDGVSGAEIIAALFDVSAQTRKIKATNRKIENTPNPFMLAINGVRENAMKVPGLLGKFFFNSVSKGTAAVVQSIAENLLPPPMPFTAPATIFNKPISNKRIFEATSIPLNEIKKIKNAVKNGVTVNDVILAVCAGALRKYLKERNALPAKSMVAFCPKSVRPEEQLNAMGNQISGMLVSLATNEEDPLQRLLLVNQSATASKMYSNALELDKLINLLPPNLAQWIAKAYQGLGLYQYHSPIANLIITNVPGPQFPLYMNGHPLLALHPIGPMTHGAGLTIAIFSYNGKVGISATACAEIVPDVDLFVRYIKEAMQELLKALPKEETIQAIQINKTGINVFPEYEPQQVEKTLKALERQKMKESNGKYKGKVSV